MEKSSAPPLTAPPPAPPPVPPKVPTWLTVVNLTGAVSMMLLLPPFTYYIWNCVVEF
jgi:hypothetical protein